MLNAENIRRDFPILDRDANGHKLIYFDNTATTQKPIQVIDAIVDYYKNHNANIHRGVHTLSQEASDMYDHSKANIADFINCQENELVFTRNATESLNLIAYSWGLKNLKEGDEIIVSGMEHHSNIVPWHILQRKIGVKVRAIEMGDDSSVSIESFEEMLNPKVKLVSVSQLSNVLGTIAPVEKMCRMAKDNGSLFAVDGAQSAPHMAVDMKKIGCDFFAFSAHKMVGPTGMGALYGKFELLSELEPFFGGGGMIKEVSIEDSTYDKPPGRFEAGTPDIAGAIGFSAAVDYLRKVGMYDIEEYERVLSKMIIDKMNDMDGIDFYGPKNIENRGAVFSFNIRGMNPHDTAMLFDQQDGIALRSGHHCAQPLMNLLELEAGTVRASPYIYNTTDEVKIFLEVLEKLST